jgi:RNA polymerase sigma-70 factor, ECF subfamily
VTQPTDERLALLLKHRWELFGFIQALVRSPQDAEDVFQEMAVVIMRKVANEGIHDFRAWSKGVARLCVLEHLRRKRSEGVTLLPTDEMVALVTDVHMADSAAELDFATEYEALRTCMGKLPERTRTLLRRRFVQGRPYEEIAQTAGGSVGAVRRAVARARLALLACVERHLRRATAEGTS